MTGLGDILAKGGLAIWVIGLLSVLTVALILWKLWRLWLAGTWSGGAATNQAIDAWESGDTSAALTLLRGRASLRARLAHAAMSAHLSDSFDDPDAREETTRVAKRLLAEARRGLRALDLIATIAPLLGLLGTVMGMISAFQALQVAGTSADPATLAGGIWEALLTTAAGMAVAIPASMAHVWFEAQVDRVQADMEDAATRIFTRAPVSAEG